MPPSPSATSEPPRRERATPLSPDERRAAIVEATVPLVLDHGFEVSTRQIAEAAGVAEGTIFRVFDDKQSLLRAALVAALDPAETERQLQAIDTAGDLRERVRETADVLQRRLREIIGLALTLGPPRFLEESDERRQRYEHLLDLLARTFEPDRDQFRCPPAQAARLLYMITFAGSHPRLNQGMPLSPDDIADVLLDGVRHHTAHDPSP